MIPCKILFTAVALVATLTSAFAANPPQSARSEVFHCSGTANQVAVAREPAFANLPTDGQILLKDQWVVIGAAPVFAMNELRIRHESDTSLAFIKSGRPAVYSGEFNKQTLALKLKVVRAGRLRWWADYACRPVKHRG